MINAACRWRATVATVIVGCLAFQTVAAELYFPPANSNWEAVTPADAGFDADTLEAAAKLAESMHSSGLLVLYQGHILLERHWRIEPDSDHSSGTYQRLLQGYTKERHAIEDVASVQKSVTAVLSGMAVTAGLLSLDEPVSVYLPEGWSNASATEERAITIRHLMTMTTGLTEALAYRDPPGKRWNYNTRSYSRMVPILESIYAKPIGELGAELLTDRIGMKDSHWINRRGTVSQNSSNFVGFATTVRDLARLGILIQANGEWEGENLGISQEYLDTMLSPSQELNGNYGLLWWLNGKPPNLKPGERYRAIPNAPQDLVAATGALGRILHVSRKEELVVVRLGNQPPREFSMELWRILTEARTQ